MPPDGVPEGRISIINCGAEGTADQPDPGQRVSARAQLTDQNLRPSRRPKMSFVTTADNTRIVYKDWARVSRASWLLSSDA